MGDEEAASAADAATKTVEETLGEAAETLNATLNATAEAAAELGPMAGGKMTALIVGGIGVAIALFVVHRRRTEAQRQLLEGGLFRSMSGAREDDDEPGAIKFDKDGKIEEVEGYDATGDNDGAGQDNDMDLVGCHPDCGEHWEKFQAARTKVQTSAGFGASDPSLEVMREAMAVFEDHLPAAHGCSVACYALLASCYMNTQQWDRAEKLCSRATSRLESAMTSNTRQTTVTLLWHLGTLYIRPHEKKGVRAAAGVQTYHRAVKLLQDMTHPSWRPLEANCYVQCAQQLLQAGGQARGPRYGKEAAEEFGLALELLEEHEGALEQAGPLRVDVLRGLALALAQQSEWDMAERRIQEACDAAKPLAVELRESALRARGNIMALQRKFKPCEICQKMVLTMAEARGAPWPDWCTFAGELAETYAHQRKFQEAHDLYHRMTSMTAQFNGGEHPSMIGPMRDLAMMKWAMGGNTDAKKLFWDAYRIASRPDVCGKDHRTTKMLRGDAKRSGDGKEYDGIGSPGYSA